VKKTKGSKRSGNKGNKSGAPRRDKAGGARKPGRIPVRGALRGGGGGVTNREAAAPAVPTPRADLAEARALALAAVDAALDKKALAPVLIDVSAMASYTDFIGIVSGRSDRQVDAIAENIRMVMK